MRGRCGGRVRWVDGAVMERVRDEKSEQRRADDRPTPTLFRSPPCDNTHARVPHTYHGHGSRYVAPHRAPRRGTALSRGEETQHDSLTSPSLLLPITQPPRAPPYAPSAPPAPRAWPPGGLPRRRGAPSSPRGELDGGNAPLFPHRRLCWPFRENASPLSRPTPFPLSLHSAERRDGGGFVSGFILGGVVFGALGFLFAPQVRKREEERGTSLDLDLHPSIHSPSHAPHP